MYACLIYTCIPSQSKAHNTLYDIKYDVVTVAWRGSLCEETTWQVRRIQIASLQPASAQDIRKSIVAKYERRGRLSMNHD